VKVVKVLLAFLAVAVCFPLSAQLTQANHDPSPGDMYSMYQCDSVSPGPSGANAVWNFSGLTTHSSIVTNYSCTVSNDWNYPSATHSVGATGFQFYYSSTAGNLKLQGRSVKAGSFYAELMYTTPGICAVYPMNLNTASSILNTSGNLNMLGPLPASGTFTGKSKAVLDGTGTLTLPGAANSFTNVMRVVSSQTISYNASYIGTITLINYDYYAPGIKAPIFTIHTTTATTQLGINTHTMVKRNKDAVAPEPPIDLVSIIENNGSDADFSVFPVPSNTSIHFKSGNPKAASVSLYEVSGRLAGKHALQDGKVSVDVSSYNKEGLYMYTIESSDGQILQRGKIVLSP